MVLSDLTAESWDLCLWNSQADSIIAASSDVKGVLLGGGTKALSVEFMASELVGSHHSTGCLSGIDKSCSFGTDKAF